MDVGGVALRYADTLNATAATFSPRLVADWGRGDAEVYGTYSQFGSGGWSTQGAISGSLFTAAARGFLPEVSGFAAGSTHQDGTRTGEVLANVRLHSMQTRGELFIGLGGGRTWVAGGSSNLILGEAGATMTLRDVTTSFVLSPTVVDSLKYMDGQLSLSLTRAKLDLGAVVGVRIGDQLTQLGGTGRSWGSVNAVRWLRPRLALVAAGGTYPIDPTQGFPGGRFVSLSIRLATQRTVAVQSVEAQGSEVEAPSAPESPVITEFAALRTSAQSVTLKVKAPRARLVEVNGDFTGWTPVPLRVASDGSWAVRLPIGPGKYQMNLRIDGGEWLVPPGLLSMLDEFGGRVGLLIIELNTKM